ncbi:DUF4258 domain-containing protein [Aeromonas jandaei]|uniref:DUF4258 domain-containing protein n=1 Tax=Aeromonas jandaei TaxID=650 RepID=UPI00191FB27C|nr:DUF4258 domain-containing protein [Aeromonas jandaei]MBL0629003.1 DUF4258 domain-containing protein [Aeromonas jandaei]MBL0629009.1 DUF4258 domain-containing protein [Aeromonas jandaei]
MNGKLDSAYSHHAACRMQQRGIAPELVELLLSIGRSFYHQGRELVYLDRKGVTMLQAEYGVPAECCQRLRGHYLVLQDGEIVTVGHKTTHFKRDRH